MLMILKRNHLGVFLLGVSAASDRGCMRSFMMLDMLTDVCRKTRHMRLIKARNRQGIPAVC